jgi:hypothetical protein
VKTLFVLFIACVSVLPGLCEAKTLGAAQQIVVSYQNDSGVEDAAVLSDIEVSVRDMTATGLSLSSGESATVDAGELFTRGSEVQLRAVVKQGEETCPISMTIRRNLAEEEMTVCGYQIRVETRYWGTKLEIKVINKSRPAE